MAKPAPAAATTDDVVRMAIEDLFPDQTIPDENNYLPSGNQFKAPDHSILGGAVLIERKSGNTVDQSQFYKKLSDIAKEQGEPFYGYGKLNFGNIIKELPDPDAANKRMTDFMLSQTWKRVGEARRKFEEYSQHIEIGGSACILVFSDNSEMRSSTAMHEYFFARKMGGIENSEDQTGRIDAIFFVKDPRRVLDEPGSYWFKCLIKERVGMERQRMISGIAAALHHRISCYRDYSASIKALRREAFRILIV